jgi:hypothetical protein
MTEYNSYESRPKCKHFREGMILTNIERNQRKIVQLLLPIPESFHWEIIILKDGDTKVPRKSKMSELDLQSDYRLVSKQLSKFVDCLEFEDDKSE